MEAIYRIEFGSRYYALASAAETITIISFAYGVIAGICSVLIYLAVLACRRITGHPLDEGHITYWAAILILTITGYTVVLVFVNKWVFTGFEIFSKRGLLYNAAFSVGYWIAVLFLIKLITPRLILRKPKMSSRSYIVMVALLALSMGAVCAHRALVGSVDVSSKVLNKTNLILISIDTLRRDRVGCFGSGLDTSPQIDEIREESITFNNAYCEIPVTNPSHVSMLTGLTMASHGNSTNGDKLDENTLTLASIMRKHGYRTAAFVSALPMIDRISNLSLGFEIYDDNLWVPAWVGDSFLLEAISLLLLKSTVENGSSLSIPAGEVIDRATAWIDDQAHQPFFLFVHLFDPHAPYAPPHDFEDMYPPRSNSEYDVNNAHYNGEVRYCDREIGSFVDHLEALGLLSRSLLVILSDHGEELGDNEEGFYGHAYYLWEESVQIPIMIRLPDGTLAGESRSDYCQIFDLVPSILPLLGMSAPDGIEFDGRDILADNVPGKNPLLFQGSPIENSIRFAVLDPPWKLIHLYELNGDRHTLLKDWLFNLEDDPFETNDLSDQAPGEIVVKLEDHLETYFLQRLAQQGSKQKKLSKEDILRLKSLGYLQ